MNPSSEHNPEVIRSEIDRTRERMDSTMDALGDRLQPRHLLDEVLGYFRADGSDGNPRIHQVRQKITEGADQAMHAVVETVKRNPIPALIVGGGIAWMIYESRRSRQDGSAQLPAGGSADRDAYVDRPLEYPGYAQSQTGGKVAELKEELTEKASAVGEKVKDTLGNAGDAIQQRYESAKNRVGEAASQVRENAAAAYSNARQKVATTVDQHPLEIGLAGLAAGLIVGLLLPTPDVVNRTVGGAADRLRDRAKETGSQALAKGRHVADAAISAVKAEAQAQGLTPKRLQEQTASIAERAQDAATQTASEEGLTLAPEGNQSGSAASNV